MTDDLARTDEPSEKDMEALPPFPAYVGQEPYLFVSYAHKDKKRVYPEIVRISEMGYRVWYDEGIEGGDEWTKTIAHALKNSYFFVVFISKNSVASENVLDEIERARDLKKRFLAVHLEETELSEELALRMNRFQAILKWKWDKQDPKKYPELLKRALQNKRVSDIIRHDNKIWMFLAPIIILLFFGIIYFTYSLPGWSRSRFDANAFRTAIESKKYEAAYKELNILQAMRPKDERLEGSLKLFRHAFSPDFSDDFLAGLEFWQAPTGWNAGQGRLLVQGEAFGFLKDKYYDDFDASFLLTFVNGKGAVWMLRASPNFERYYLFQLTGPKGTPPNVFNGYRFLEGKSERIFGPTQAGINLNKLDDQINILIKARQDVLEHFVSTADNPETDPLSLSRITGLTFPGGLFGFGTRDGEEFLVRALQIVNPPANAK